MHSSIVREDVDRILAAPLPWQRLFGKTVLITGAGGFLASHLVHVLAALNDRGIGAPCRILAMVRDPVRAEARLKPLIGRDDLVVLHHDVTEPLDLDGPVDVVIHAASQASPRYYGIDPVGTLNANTLGTHAMLALARRKEAETVLFFSSSEVYGEVPPDHVPTPEDRFGHVDPATVRACYAESKRMGETMCVAWSHQYGVPTRIVRPFHTYGPGMALDDGRVFADFVADVLAHRDLVLKSDGTAMRAFCYVADATEAFFTVLLKGETATPYNVGNDAAEIGIRGLAELLVAEFSERNLRAVVAPDRQGAGYLPSTVSRNCPDLTRIRALGWAPRTGLAEGFRRTVTSFEASTHPGAET